MRTRTIAWIMPFATLLLTPVAQAAIDGSDVIRIEKASRHGTEGATFSVCALDADTKALVDCRNIGKRAFYSLSEIEALKKKAEKSCRTFDWDGAGMGAFCGMFMGYLVTAIAPGEWSVISMGVGASLLGAIGGLGTDPAKDKIRSALQGGLEQESTVIEIAEFEGILEFLSRELDAIDP